MTIALCMRRAAVQPREFTSAAHRAYSTELLLAWLACRHTMPDRWWRSALKPIEPLLVATEGVIVCVVRSFEQFDTLT